MIAALSDIKQGSFCRTPKKFGSFLCGTEGVSSMVNPVVDLNFPRQCKRHLDIGNVKRVFVGVAYLNIPDQSSPK